MSNLSPPDFAVEEDAGPYCPHGYSPASPCQIGCDLYEHHHRPRVFKVRIGLGWDLPGAKALIQTEDREYDTFVPVLDIIDFMNPGTNGKFVKYLLCTPYYNDSHGHYLHPIEEVFNHDW